MTISESTRQQVFKRADYCCEYCQTSQAYSGIALEIDHIIPQSANGSDDLANLCAACHTCNQHKHMATNSADPKTNAVVQLFNPSTQNWHEHFEWSDDTTEIIGKTPIGRATIYRLKMNNRFVVLARKLWQQAGWIPSQD